MPAVFSCPTQAAAPVANAAQEEKAPINDFSVSLAGSLPEMYRRTLTAMIDGQKISPLIPLPHMDCCSKPALNQQTEISRTEDSEGTLEEELVERRDVEAEKAHNENSGSVSGNEASASWVFKPSVGTWLVPLHAHAVSEGETALTVESSVPAACELKAVKVAKVQRKGLAAKIKTWFCCVQASAAEPKAVKGAKTAKMTAKSKP